MTLQADRPDLAEELASEKPPPDDDAAAAEWRATPHRIGRYELRFELASGGMGSVYLARLKGTAGFEKLVALKRIHPHLARTKSYIDMFLDEARIASQITHPNVCSVFNFGEADGEYYLAMEYLLGEPLSRLWRSTAKSREQRRSTELHLRVARIIEGACEGLHAAHELRDASGKLLEVVHRDVSLRNLFVTYDGGVQVVDFGLASARERLHHSATGDLKGSYAFMSPEQVRSDVIDRRADIWSLGVVLWEMLALKRLFKRDTHANTMCAVMLDEVPPPSTHRPQVPRELDEIVMKALERDPDERWQTAREMGQALRGFLSTTKELIGPAELSDWMAELFPHEQAKKAQLMELARMPHGPVLSIPIRGEFDVTQTMDGRFTDPPVLEPAPSRRIKKSGLIAGGLLALMALAVLGLGLDRSGGQPASPEAVVPEAVSEAEPPRAEVVEPSTSTQAPPEEPVATEVVPAAIERKVRAKRRARPRVDKRTAEPGVVSVVTRGGWAEVFKDGKSLGSTPKLLTLPPGRHKLLLRPSGNGTPKRIYVDVESGRTKKVAVALD